MNQAAGRVLLVAGLAGALGARPARAQSVAQVAEAIDHARVATRILYITAHPDDERSSVLAYLSRGLGADVALCSTTRGEGGQNAIGPELGPALKILRTEELYRATREYGVHLFFTRAPDFGFSKSAEETLRIWGDAPKEDLVRIIRTFRPEIVINQWGGVHWGHGQHQATGIITPEAVKAAADAQAYPRQLQQGLAPWKVTWVLQFPHGAEEQKNAIRLPVDEISPLWGESYVALGLKGFANHRSQGVTRFLGSPFFRRPAYLIAVEGKNFTAADFAQPITILGERLPGRRSSLEPTLVQAETLLGAAKEAALNLKWADAASSLARAAGLIQEEMSGPNARGALGANTIWELQQEQHKIDVALAEVAAVHLRAIANRADLVRGEDFSVHVDWNSRPGAGVVFSKPSLELLAGWTASEEKSPQGSEATGALPGASFRVSFPPDILLPRTPAEAVQPWPPPLVQAKLEGTVGGYTFTVKTRVVAKNYTSTKVETLPLDVVPAVTLSVEPQQIMVAENQPAKPLALLVRAGYHGEKPAEVSLGLLADAGWHSAPVAPMKFSNRGDRLARLLVTPPAHLAAGAYELHLFARLGGQKFLTSLEPVPSVPGRPVYGRAVATVHVLDLAIRPRLRVGYIAAGIDPVPQTLEQLGVRVDLLDEAALAFGNLDRYNVIVVGIRAYELRPDVIRENPRLLDYVRRGGTLLVQYERDFAWNKLLPAPFPARMDQPAERITDETAAVRFVDPACPLLNFPNHIGPADFEGWVQERGLYFWGQWDPRYHAVLAMHDPGEADALGGLVYAPYGKGMYIYTGLAFFRQLPAGVPGAYRLFANLLSASQQSAAGR